MMRRPPKPVKLTCGARNWPHPRIKSAVDHVDYKKSRNPDTELHLNGEDDSLYDDGLDLDDDTDTLAGTDGNTPGGVKG